MEHGDPRVTPFPLHCTFIISTFNNLTSSLITSEKHWKSESFNYTEIKHIFKMKPILADCAIYAISELKRRCRTWMPQSMLITANSSLVHQLIIKTRADRAIKGSFLIRSLDRQAKGTKPKKKRNLKTHSLSRTAFSLSNLSDAHIYISYRW